MQTFLYILLIIFAIAFFWVGYKKELKSCFGYAFGALSLVFLIYIAANFPDIKIKAPGLEYERIQKIETNQEELKNIVTSLVKMNLATLDGVGRFGDNADKRTALIRKYKKEMDPYLPSDLDEKLNRDLKSVNK